MHEYIIQTKSPLVKSDNNSLKDYENRNINLAPSRVLKTLLSIIVFLLGFHLLGAVSREIFPQQVRINNLLEKFFDFNSESNFPTYFSAIQLFAASLLLFFICSLKNIPQIKKDKKFWFFLGAIFLFLSFDEATMIHEELVHTLRNRIENLPGLLYYTWVIPYSIFILGICFYFFRFLFSLPVKTRNLFIISGFIFVAGALGLEIIEGYIEKMGGRESLTYFGLITIEELCEMASISIFIYALLSYLAPIRINLFLKNQED